MREQAGARRSPLLSLVLAALLSGCLADPGSIPHSELEVEQFRLVMEELAAAWNAGDARRAAACFTADAVYSEPPDKQLYTGRQALFEFFGGDEGRAGEMSMAWHHLAFSPDTQVGFGEFSFTYGSAAHGVAVVKVQDGRISNWREYWYGSELPWDEFQQENPF